ncbi:unnamed protein product [Caenorhabditis auriculariae]|uniref:Uncharacterized protein n=1 Tax=Caenorhabditis auriculariae TaxID=2777116 RepID=A0A8S1H443_9PELO|nr:unnamed protein product [Caenorhabditis auriculariae]
MSGEERTACVNKRDGGRESTARRETQTVDVVDVVAPRRPPLFDQIASSSWDQRIGLVEPVQLVYDSTRDLHRLKGGDMGAPRLVGHHLLPWRNRQRVRLLTERVHRGEQTGNEGEKQSKFGAKPSRLLSFRVDPIEIVG